MTIWEQETEDFYIQILSGNELIQYSNQPSDDGTVEYAVQINLLDFNKDAWLTDIEVSGGDSNPDHDVRKQGIGSKILAQYEEKCRKSGIRRIVGEFAPDEGYHEKLKSWYLDKGYSLYVTPMCIYIFKDL